MYRINLILIIMKIWNIFILYFLIFVHFQLLGKDRAWHTQKSCLNICLKFDFVPVRAVLMLSLGPRARKVLLCTTKDRVQPSELPGNEKH